MTPDNRFDYPPEIGGLDALDAEVVRTRAPRPSRFDVLWRSRPALGLAPAATPAVVFVSLGFVLGPSAAGVLSADVVSHLDPVVALGLASLGAFIGLSVEIQRQGEQRLAAAASAEAGVTMVLVALGVFGWRWAVASRPDALFIASLMVLAVAASASASLAARATWGSLSARIADFDDLLPVLVGALVLATASAGGIVEGVILVLLLAVAVSVLTSAGRWLLDVSSGEAERITFVAGTLLLVAGSAEYLGLSMLFAGLLAGLVWTRTSTTHEQLQRRLARIQHPVVIVLLLVAGASTVVTAEAATFALVFALLRLIGKLAGGVLAARIAGTPEQTQLGRQLLTPGVIGIAFALDAGQAAALGFGSTSIVTIVAMGSVLSELIALALAPSEARS